MTAAPRTLVFPPHSNSGEGRKTVGQTNKMFQDVRIPWTLPMLQSADVLTTGLATLGSVGTRTLTDADVAGSWDDSAAAGTKFTADTADVASAGAADVLLMPASEAAGDKFIMGFLASRGVPAGIEAIYSTAGIGGTGRWVYLNNHGIWTAFPKVIDPTAQFITAAATFDLAFQIPND